MKKLVRTRFAMLVPAMLAIALAVWAAAPKADAGPCRSACAAPPEDCIFLGCDSAGNCIFQC
jgi:hypothetical protein